MKITQNVLILITLTFLSGCGGTRDAGMAPIAESPARPEVKASRVFAGPGQYPPSQFAAYGIVAFQALAADEAETTRYISICQGFLAAIPASTSLQELGVPLNEQMATIWPLKDKVLANTLNSMDEQNHNNCRSIVSSVGLVASRDAISKAKKSFRKVAFDGRGPYVIAWSPSKSFGQPDAAVLVLNLSNVTTRAQAVEMFRSWSERIEQDPGLWKGGWNLNGLRIALQLWADRWGPGVLVFLTPQNN